MRATMLALAILLSALAIALLLWGAGPHHPLQAQRLLAQFDTDESGWLEAEELTGSDPPGFSWRLHDLNRDYCLAAREVEILVEELDPLWVIRMPGSDRE